VIDLLNQSAWADWAFEAVSRAAEDGPVAIDHVVLAELHAGPVGGPPVSALLDELRISMEALDDRTAARAGEAHRLYRARGGARGLIADFLIGAHAVTLGARLLTRDRARFASYFPELDIIAPEERPT